VREADGVDHLGARDGALLRRQGEENEELGEHHPVYTVVSSSVSMPLRDNGDVGCKAGWSELRAGRWEAARAAFGAAGDTAEALEGLSWAAWWIDDAVAVFDARERA
jgi:hypothetical protein